MPFSQRPIFAKPVAKNDTYLVHRKPHRRFNKAIPQSWINAAEAKGFTLIDRVDNRYNLLLLCHACGDLTIRPRNVVVDHTPECHSCIRLRREKAAFKVGAELLFPHPNQRPYCYFRLSCGHIVARPPPQAATSWDVMLAVNNAMSSRPGHLVGRMKG